MARLSLCSIQILDVDLLELTSARSVSRADRSLHESGKTAMQREDPRAQRCEQKVYLQLKWNA